MYTFMCMFVMYTQLFIYVYYDKQFYNTNIELLDIIIMTNS